MLDFVCPSEEFGVQEFGSQRDRRNGGLNEERNFNLWVVFDLF